MFGLWLVACAAPSPLVGETLTEDGSWRLTLATTEYDQGEAEVSITADRADDQEPATGLDVFARPGMATMTHTAPVVDFVEEGEATYTSTLLLDMPGLWTITGYAGEGEAMEGFTFVVEVQP